MDGFKNFCEGVYSLAKAGIIIVVIVAVVFGIKPLIDALEVIGSSVRVASASEKLAIENLKLTNFEKAEEFFRMSYELHPTEDVKVVLRMFEDRPGDTLTYAAADSILSMYHEKRELPYGVIRKLAADQQLLEELELRLQ